MPHCRKPHWVGVHPRHSVLIFLDLWLLLFQSSVILYALNIFDEYIVWMMLGCWIFYDFVTFSCSVANCCFSNFYDRWEFHFSVSGMGITSGLIRIALFFNHGFEIFSIALSVVITFSLMMVICFGVYQCHICTWLDKMLATIVVAIPPILNITSLTWRCLACWNGGCSSPMTAWIVIYFPIAIMLAILSLGQVWETMKGNYLFCY